MPCHLFLSSALLVLHLDRFVGQYSPSCQFWCHFAFKSIELSGHSSSLPGYHVSLIMSCCIAGSDAASQHHSNNQHGRSHIRGTLCYTCIASSAQQSLFDSHQGTLPPLQSCLVLPASSFSVCTCCVLMWKSVCLLCDQCCVPDEHEPNKIASTHGLCMLYEVHSHLVLP